ncbi:MAG: acetaldehyde dehydrogenase (acetylating), partial [Gammaproteobacteria bacterium]|nr:acetaldehyde dehydrogenase (acetylating) [Gammaproteobacteria bacterium]
MTKIGCAILGSGNIGTDLMIKIQETSKILDLKIVIGLEETSEGLAMARARGIATTHEGIEVARQLSEWSDVSIVFDATSAGAHVRHNEACQVDGKQMIDLTPAAIGPYCVPVVNFEDHLGE